jgi:hypothetical protein
MKIRSRDKTSAHGHSNRRCGKDDSFRVVINIIPLKNIDTLKDSQIVVVQGYPDERRPTPSSNATL